MVIVVILILIIFLPSCIEIASSSYNLHVIMTVKIRLFYVLPFSVTVFNEAKAPTHFYYKIFGKIKDLKRLQEKIIAKDTEKASEFVMRHKSKTWQWLKFVMRRIKVFRFVCHLGIKERADYTAVFTGCLNGAFVTVSKMLGGKKANVCFVPKYGMDMFATDFKCIINFSAANIIHESIRHFFKRR